MSCRVVVRPAVANKRSCVLTIIRVVTHTRLRYIVINRFRQRYLTVKRARLRYLSSNRART